MPTKSAILSFEVQENRLFVNRNGACTHRISLWPRPQAEMRNSNGVWERFYPEFRLIGYPLPKPKDTSQLELGLDVQINTTSTQSKRLAYDQLRQTMPLSYSMALAPFKSHQWNMIVFLSFYRRFYQLIKANPAIAFLLANRREFNWKIYRKEISLEDLTGMKQTQLLEQLGLPGTKNMVQITKKIHPSSIRPELLEMLKKCTCQEDVLKQLSHLKKINAGVLAVAGSARISRHVTPQLLEEISINGQNNHYPMAAHTLREIIEWHGQLRKNRAFPRFKHLADLEVYYDELVDGELRTIAEEERRVNRFVDPEKLIQQFRKPLGRPPIQAGEHIKPLRTAAALLREGQLQRNCVGGYADRVRLGRCYIYRVTAPERATLSVIRTAGGEWIIGELFASCNRPVRPETKETVNDWLAGEQLGI